jgi:hypothetical protein
MEFVDGVNLRQLQKARRLSPREALQIIPQICDALQYAHDEGVVHRDIKPENVLVDRKGRVKIADFGLAKILGRGPEALRLTGEGQVMDTPHYMAPEQVEHPLTVDHRADIYSLGVVFYEMLTGELPLGRFQPPSRKVQVDVRLDEVVLHALEKEPDRRYQHASQVKTDVQQVAAGSPPPVQSRPQSLSAAAVAGKDTTVLRPELQRTAVRAWKLVALVILGLLLLNLIFVMPALLKMLSHSPPAATAPGMPAGLVSWWRGEGNAVDSAGGNNGRLMNRVGFEKGVVGQAFHFNGLSYVEVPDSPTLRFPEALTICCWAKRLQTSEIHTLVEKGGVWTGGETDFESTLNDIYPGGSHFGFCFAGGWRACAVTPDTAWHHYAVVVTNGQPDPVLYLDGVPQAITFRGGPATIHLSSSGRPLHLGATVDRQSGWSYYSSKLIDECALFKRALSASEIQGIVAANGSAQTHAEAATGPPGLVGHWRADGDAKDSAGTNNGVLLGNTSFAPGKVGRAFSFDPASGTVLVPDAPSLRLTRELTIAAWINLRSFSDPGGYAVVSKLGVSSGNNGYQLVVVENTLHGLFNSPGLPWPSQRIISEPVITTGTWYHVAFTYDQNQMRLYCNGKEVATKDIGPHPIATSPADLRISGADDHGYFDGLVDEVAVFNQALTDEEIAASYRAGVNAPAKAHKMINH